MSKVENISSNNKRKDIMSIKSVFEGTANKSVDNDVLNLEVDSEIQEDNHNLFDGILQKEREILFEESLSIANTVNGQDWIISGVNDLLVDEDGNELSIVQWGALFDGHGLKGKSFGIPELIRRDAKLMLENTVKIISKEYMLIDKSERSNYVSKKIQCFVDELNNKSESLIEENVKYLLGKDIDRTGSTMIIVIITEDRLSHIGWLGDSTCCIFKEEKIFWRNKLHKADIPKPGESITSMIDRYQSGGYGCSKFSDFADKRRVEMRYSKDKGYYSEYYDTEYDGYCIWKNVVGNRLAFTKSLGHVLVRKADPDFSKISFETIVLDNGCSIMMCSDGVSDIIPNVDCLFSKTALEIKDFAISNWSKPVDVFYKKKKLTKNAWSFWDSSISDYQGRDDVSVIVFSPFEDRKIKRRKSNTLTEDDMMNLKN